MSLLTHSFTTVYPMDSAELTVDSDGLPVYDRPYNAADLRGVIRRMVTDGVYPDYLDELAPSNKGGAWYVGAGGAMVDGLYVPVPEAVKVADQADIPSGQYAYICVAGRFDMSKRDGAVYARLSSNSSEKPLRDGSTYELIIARVDWRGTLTDYRTDADRCGLVGAVNKIDGDSFMAELKESLKSFDVQIGDVTVAPPLTTPQVTVRKSGYQATLDFEIPRGLDGRPGRDAPNIHIAPADKAPEARDGEIWLVDSEDHTITDIRAYETDEVYPSAGTFPGLTINPGGQGQWISHKLAPGLVASA